MTNAFKVGDKVKIVCKVKVSEGWGDDWVKPMDKTIGRIGHIYEITQGGYSVEFFDFYDEWNYPVEALELIGE